MTTLTSAQLTGWRWDGAAYETASLPATTFTYSEPTFDSAVRLTTGLDELPNGLDPRRWQLLDLDGEGLPGLLTEQGGAWRYKRNEGSAHFAPARLVDLRPPLAAHPGARLTDIDGDGRLDLVLLRPAQSGHQPRTADGGWDSFRPFSHAPNPLADGPDARLIDVDGVTHQPHPEASSATTV